MEVKIAVARSRTDFSRSSFALSAAHPDFEVTFTNINMSRRYLPRAIIVCGVALLAAIGATIWLSPRTQITESHTSLQNGKKMDVRLTFRSPWGLKPADRFVGLDVSIDGKNMPVAQAAYEGLPVDPGREPAIVERKGFPEIKLRGKEGAAFDELYLRFQNYSFSERRIVKGRKSESTYYATPHEPLKAIQVANYNAPLPSITLGEESVKSASMEEHTK